MGIASIIVTLIRRAIFVHIAGIISIDAIAHSGFLAPSLACRQR